MQGSFNHVYATIFRFVVESRNLIQDKIRASKQTEEQTADCKQQTADSRQQTAHSTQQTADSRQQITHLRLQVSPCLRIDC
jgi:methyl-accepting chemotaxis protein